MLLDEAAMYCPNCTTEISTGHRYCRGCGVDLREISQALGGARNIETRSRSEEARPAPKVSASLTQWSWGFFLGVLGLVFVWEFTGLGSALIFLAICLMVSSYFVRDRSPKTRRPPTNTNELSPKSPAPSVTERTTKLFEGQESEGSRTARRSAVGRNGPM